ncbi:MAG: hypothetical protein HY921_12820 [Elusimicrobia bacterium]|nr:hypothetical protein [Elusimicrobiota bacterium]
MKSLGAFWLAVIALAASGCGGFKALRADSGACPNCNFELESSEAVPGLEEDSPAYVQIYIDGLPAGRTAALPKSQEKKWGRRLPAGNHLFRFEYWTQAAGGAWAPAEASRQPHERFIRVEREGRAKIVLKFYDGGRKHSFQVLREP